jgi:hypothetical protein
MNLTLALKMLIIKQRQPLNERYPPGLRYPGFQETGNIYDYRAGKLLEFRAPP